MLTWCYRWATGSVAETVLWRQEESHRLRLEVSAFAADAAGAACADAQLGRVAGVSCCSGEYGGLGASRYQGISSNFFPSVRLYMIANGKLAGQRQDTNNQGHRGRDSIRAITSPAVERTDNTRMLDSKYLPLTPASPMHT